MGVFRFYLWEAEGRRKKLQYEYKIHFILSIWLFVCILRRQQHRLEQHRVT